jgi:small subunit ribosomal protein S6
MSEYELVYIIRPDAEADRVSGVIDKVREAISGQGGQVTAVEPWGLRRLAYPIRKHREGHYVTTQLQIDPSKLRELERSFKLSEDILRHLIVHRVQETERVPSKGRGVSPEPRTQ